MANEVFDLVVRGKAKLVGRLFRKLWTTVRIPTSCWRA